MSPSESGASRTAERSHPTPPRQTLQAKSRENALSDRLAVYLRLHLHVILFSLGRLAQAPMASLMTTTVIAISLALPTGLYVSLDNLRGVSGNWERAAQLSLFLKQDVSDEQARHLVERVRSREDVAQAELILKDQALEEFRRTSGFGDALNALPENPLPTVISIQPKPGIGIANIRLQVETLGTLDEIELAQLDMDWLQRLFAMMDIIQRMILIIAVLLAAGVLLVVGNTIRLDIENRRDEIIVSKLIGATNGFIRRPFLYSGIWYGLIGGLLAWIAVSTGMTLLEDPVQRLTHLYQSGFQLQGLGFLGGLSLLGLGALLAWLGTWLAVGRHLRQIEPT